MPIRPELRPFYPPHWHELSSYVRFERAEGRCQRCRRPHLTLIRCLPDGRWFDEQTATWRDRQGRMARWPDLMEATRFRMTRVVLAAAHLDSDPRNNRLTNLRALCQRCHLLQDRSHHLAQRWITYRRRRAIGDLFLGPYQALVAALPSKYRARSSGTQRSPTDGVHPNRPGDYRFLVKNPPRSAGSALNLGAGPGAARKRPEPIPLRTAGDALALPIIEFGARRHAQ
jgi:hypothetical protein